MLHRKTKKRWNIFHKDRLVSQWKRKTNTGPTVDSAGLILNQSRVLALNIKNKTVGLTFNSVLTA